MTWIIKTSKIMVRPVQIEDASTLVRWWNDGNIMKDVGFNNGIKTDIVKVEKQIKNQNHSNVKLFIICDTNNKQPIGELSYGELDLNDRSCRIGIKICETNLQGKRYGHDSICEFIKYLFTCFALNLIYIDTLHTNIRAINLYKKIGSDVIEIKKDFWTNPEGIIYDVVFLKLYKNKFLKYISNIQK